MSNSSFYSTTGATSNQEDAIEASVNNAAASETAAAASSATSTAQATISTDKATESAASAAAALVSQNSASSSSTSANTSKNSASVSASAASSSASAASGSASTASSKAAQALSSSNSSSSSASTASTARDASIAAKNSSVTAQGLSEAARDASIAAKTASETAETNAETAETNAAASSTTSTTKANESAASAAAALSSKNSSDTNSATATTKASEAASSATASAASATASAASATTSTASKNTAVAVTANFLGAHSSAPTATASGGSLAVGMLYFDTGSDVLKVRASGGWINAGSSINGTSARFAYTLSANQTTVSGNDLSGNSLQFDAPFVDVFLNGVKLAAADMNISSGTSVVLAAGATAGDILEVVAFGTFQLTNGTFAGTTTVNNLTITGTATAPTQAAGNDTTRLATTAFTQAAITALVGSVPATLNTLAELGDALGDDPNYATTTSNLIGTKLPLAGGAITGDVTFGDNNKAIFGAGSALKLYHSGSSSILDNTTGGLFFNQWVDNADITFQNDDSTGGTTAYMLMQGSTGEVQLKHYGSTKISTKASGVEVAGNIAVSGTVDGVDIAARDAVLTATTTTANAALPKSGGTMTGNATFNGSFTQFNHSLNLTSTAINIDFMETGVTDQNHRIRQNSGNLSFGKLSNDKNTVTENMLLDGNAGTIFNNGRVAGYDFRVASDTKTHMLFVDAGTDRVGINESSPDARLHISDSAVSTSFVRIENTASHEGSIQFKTAHSAASDYRLGASISESNNFELFNVDANTGFIKVGPEGAVRMPLQPAFSARPTDTQTNIGVATTTVKFHTQMFDVNDDFRPSTGDGQGSDDSNFVALFTAPVTGKYQLNMSLRLENIDSAATYYQIAIVTPNRNYRYIFDPDFGQDNAFFTPSISVLADMDTGDTAHVTIAQSSGTAQTDIHSESAFNGVLVA